MSVRSRLVTNCWGAPPSHCAACCASCWTQRSESQCRVTRGVAAGVFCTPSIACGLVYPTALSIDNICRPKVGPAALQPELLCHLFLLSQPIYFMVFFTYFHAPGRGSDHEKKSTARPSRNKT